MSDFATAGHLALWAHLMPAQRRERRQASVEPASPRRALAQDHPRQCAHAAKNKRGSYYQAQYLRLRSRRGRQKAICALAASILTAIYHMLKNATVYQDLGADHFSRRSQQTHARSLLRRLEHMGYAVQTTPLAAKSPSPPSEWKFRVSGAGSTIEDYNLNTHVYDTIDTTLRTIGARGVFELLADRNWTTAGAAITNDGQTRVRRRRADCDGVRRVAH